MKRGRRRDSGADMIKTASRPRRSRAPFRLRANGRSDRRNPKWSSTGEVRSRWRDAARLELVPSRACEVNKKREQL